MSIFSQNLPKLRRQAGYTQEGLAEALGVSRQAVGKWEAGQTLPEAATLLELAELLDCSLDQLMRLPLEEELLPPEPEPKPDGGEEVWRAYERHMNHFAVQISSGVALCLMGVAALLALLAVGGPVPGVMALFFYLAAAVFLFVRGGMEHDAFRRSHPVIPDYRDVEEMERFRRIFGIGIALAIAAILADVALLVGLIAMALRVGWKPVCLPAALFFLILGGAVGTIVLLGLWMEKYDLEGWARESHGQAKLEQRVEEQVQRELEQALTGQGRDWSGAIMLTATGIFWVAGFLFDAWGTAWVVFPLGGILCGIVEALQRKR